MRLGDSGHQRIMVVWLNDSDASADELTSKAITELRHSGCLSQPGEHVQRLLSQRTLKTDFGHSTGKPIAANRLHASELSLRRLHTLFAFDTRPPLRGVESSRLSLRAKPSLVGVKRAEWADKRTSVLYDACS